MPIETHYVPYDDQRLRSAYVWAKEQGVRKGWRPGDVPSSLIDSLMAQWLAAHPVEPATTERG